MHKISNYFSFTCLLDSKEMLQVSEAENNIYSTKHAKLNEARLGGVVHMHILIAGGSTSVLMAYTYFI